MILVSGVFVAEAIGMRAAEDANDLTGACETDKEQLILSGVRLCLFDLLASVQLRGIDLGVGRGR